MREGLLCIVAVLLVAFAVQYIEVTEKQALLGAAKLGEEVEIPKTVRFMIEDGMSREAIAEKTGHALGFDAETVHQLHDTYRSMQWMTVSDVLVPHLVEAHELTEEDREVLLTHSTVYLDREDDILESLYVSQEYTIPSDATVAEAAEALIAPLQEEKERLVPEMLDDVRVTEVLEYIKSSNELLPDLVPLPPQDIEVRNEGDRTLLVFSTIYYNQGRGPLELRADQSTIGVIGDFDRDVFQRIYKRDGSYRERTAGTFEWHSEHLHYHFIDFIEYRLEALDPSVEREEKLSEKSTFCIRDVSRVYLQDIASTSADYRICGRERQGVSIGWGDAYFNNYVDQNLDITDLSSGNYRLSFYANPEDRFDEITKENNLSSTDIYYDRDAGTVEVLSHKPSDLPEFEHIHVEQKL